MFRATARGKGGVDCELPRQEVSTVKCFSSSIDT